MTPKNSLTPDLIEVVIDSLSYNGGRGVGRHDGVVVFVPGTAPGERVRVRIVKRHERFLEAELIDILSPSSHRRDPPCPVAGRCGGCSWQHVAYGEQVRQKEKILRDSLRRLTGFQWQAFVPAPDEFHYRNRIQLQIQNGQRGFFAKRTRDLVTFEKCWIADDRLNEKISSLTESDVAGQRKVELAITESGELRVMAGERDPEAALFSQVNSAQNEKLKELMLASVEIAPAWILDLYAGAGNLTLPLAERFAGVPLTAVELSRPSIERARKTAAAVDWQVGDVAAVLKRTKAKDGAGLIVCDPPRTGMDADVIAQLQRLRPAQILYVSCNPTTFARDAERLQPGFRLEHVRGLDMFPQTEHVELIASLRAATTAC